MSSSKLEDLIDIYIFTNYFLRFRPTSLSLTAQHTIRYLWLCFFAMNLVRGYNLIILQHLKPVVLSRESVGVIGSNILRDHVRRASGSMPYCWLEELNVCKFVERSKHFDRLPSLYFMH